MKSMMCARRMAGSQELSNDKLQRVAAAYAGLTRGLAGLINDRFRWCWMEEEKARREAMEVQWKV